MANVVDGMFLLEHTDWTKAAHDPAQLRRLAKISQHLQNHLAAVDARIARLAAACPGTTVADVFAGRGDRATNQACDRAETTDTVPELGAALDNGEVTGEHVDALARAARKLDAAANARLAARGAELAESAKVKTPEQFRHDCEDAARAAAADEGVSVNEQLRRERRIRRYHDFATGARKTTFTLDAETDAKLWSAIEAITAHAKTLPQAPGLTFAQLQTDAVIDHITNRPTIATNSDSKDGEGTGNAGTNASTGKKATIDDRYLGRVPQVSVLIDWTTLLNGLSASSICEYVDGTKLPVDTVRRMCCDADIIPIVLGSKGDVLDVGRAERTANRAQRRAIEAMYRTCSHPDCTVPVARCEIHHITPWHRGGLTDLDKLTPLCDDHHHLVHEGRWTITLTPDRTITWTRPDGTIYFHGSTIDRRPATRPERQPAGTPPPTNNAPQAETEAEITGSAHSDADTDEAGPDRKRTGTEPGPPDADVLHLFPLTNDARRNTG